MESGKIYYDSLRKLITIEYFLKKNEIGPDEIDNKLLNLIEKEKLEYIKNNGKISGKIKKEVDEIILKKLNLINELLKNVKKR